MGQPALEAVGSPGYRQCKNSQKNRNRKHPGIFLEMDVQEISTYPPSPECAESAVPQVQEGATLPAMLSAMTGSSCPVLAVGSGSTLTSWQLLRALARMLPHSDEFSEIEAVSMPSDYSASSVARAVEDADASLLSLLVYPDETGMLALYLRINRADPSHAVRSLGRYGYTVTRARGAGDSDAALAAERLSELQHYLDI